MMRDEGMKGREELCVNNYIYTYLYIYSEQAWSKANSAARQTYCLNPPGQPFPFFLLLFLLLFRGAFWGMNSLF